MKKMLDSKFLFILGLSILVLIGLGITAFYLFDDSDNHFIKSGYVINPLSSKVEKYFFEEETSYHENLSSMIEFKDIDNNNVTILRDSFLHYEDGGMSFLKNGAILDLNSINGKEAVSFYNITNESIIEKFNEGYVINTNTHDIRLKNFVGRINDDKYIVVGNLELKVPGNNTTIKGEYFEIVYTENGIVNIENRENKYQVTAEGTYIYVGDILIDLGNKKIAKGKEDIMSITAITINGDENVEIIPKAKEEKTTTINNNGNGNNNGNNNQGNNDGNGKNDNQNNEPGYNDKENDLNVIIKNAEVTSTDITVKFDIENDVLTDNFSLRVINLETGEIVKKYDSIESNRSYNVSFLTPDTKYLFTVINESDNSKYVQKIIETNKLGISIEKAYATENKLGYLITIGENTEATSAKLVLKKFNEETGQTENVKDEEGNDRVIELRNLNNGQTTIEESFGDLESNSIYTAVLTNFMVPPYNLESNYELAVTTMTLKKTPDFGKLKWNKDKTERVFTFYISGIVDEDNAIRKYTYTVYPKNPPTLDTEDETANQIIPTIINNTASPVQFEVGEGKLEIGTEYYYKVVIEYYDNEKILEYVSENYDDYVLMEEEPYVRIVPDRENTSYNRIYGTIYLLDKSCLLNSNDSDECSLTRNAIVQVFNDPTGNNDENQEGIITKNIKFVPDENDEGKLKATLDIGGLEEGLFYTVRVKANRTDMPNSGAVLIDYTPDSARGIYTKSLSTFVINWTDEESNRQNVVNVTSQFVADNIGDIGKENSALAIKRVELSLYEGKVTPEMIENNNVSPMVDPIVKVYTNNFDIKESFYDNSYPIGSNNTFNLNYESLASKSTDGKIQEYYTIYIRAYYDERGTRPIELSREYHSYRVDDALRREDLGEMKITVSPIIQGTTGPFTNLNNTDTVIGYNVTPSWETSKLLAAHFEPKKIKITVYNKANNQPVSFYVKENDTLKLKQFIYEDISSATYQIYMSYGKETSDSIMRRGNEYYVGFEIEAMSTIDNEGRMSSLPVNDSGIPRNYGKYTIVREDKDTPALKTYVTKSTENSVTYWYEIIDPDNALYRTNTESDYGLYYDIDGTEHMLSIATDKSEDSTYDYFSNEESNSLYNYFSGNITIPNLAKGDYYALYLKNGNEDNNYPRVSDDTLKLFEGKYQASDYHFKYTVINNELTDNEVKIKIFGDEEFLSRIVNYKLTFTTKKTDGTIDKSKSYNFWKLSTCNDNSEENRCLIVDYQTLKEEGMKSTSSSIKTIYVDVEAMYDNGLTGYGYTVGDKNAGEYDYEYMIMQDNNTKSLPGNYISFTEGVNNSNYKIIVWRESENIHKGYYRYEIREDRRRITYTSYYAKTFSASNINTTKEFPLYTLGIDGRKVTINNEQVALNPKMLTIEEMPYDNNNFSFSSYTPEIKIEKETPIINGENLTITLSGADYNEFCEENGNNTCVNHGLSGTYKLYIDVWDNLEDIGKKDKIVRPTKEITLDNNNLNAPITDILIDKLKDSTTYYFRVYAWLNKNNTKNYTQLFDKTLSYTNHAFTTKDYRFTTLSAENLYNSINIKSILSDAEDRQYGDRMINTEIKLTAYPNSVKINYDIAYAICDKTATAAECKPSTASEESLSDIILLTNTITSNKVRIPYNDKLAIDSNFEHGKTYKAFLYAIYEYYDNYNPSQTTEPVTKELLLGGGNRDIEPLRKPYMNDVSREALLTDDDYVIDIIPHIVDPDETLINGEYYVKLLSGNSIVVGDMQVMQDGSYVTIGTDGQYENLQAFDIEDINNQMNPIRISNLTQNTVYTIVVYGTANLNNYDPDISIENRKVLVQTDPPIIIYSADENGVAFGKIDFSINRNSVYVTFLGGTNVSNIERIEYTIGTWRNYDIDNETFYDENQTYSGSYLISERGFTSDDSNNPQYIISPPGMDLDNDNGNINDAYPIIVYFYLSNTELPIKRIGTPLYTNK